jgi:hypothetical protein
MYPCTSVVAATTRSTVPLAPNVTLVKHAVAAASASNDNPRIRIDAS